MERRNGVQTHDLRKYLLGQSDSEEMRAIEEKLMIDDDFELILSDEEEDLIELYLEGGLTESERSDFRKHFLSLPERAENFLIIRNLKQRASTLSPPEQKSRSAPWFRAGLNRLFAPPAIRIAAGLLLVVGASFLVWRFALSPTGTDKGLAQLRVAYGGLRQTESRISADLPYAPPSALRGAGEKPGSQAARNKAELSFLEATEGSENPRARHGLGQLYLLEGREDEALRELALAAEARPDDPEIEADLGAAYYEQARRLKSAAREGEAMESFSRGLAHIDRALRLNGKLAPALFNRALILQELNLTDQAHSAWNAYLAVDADSEWAREARERLERLHREISTPVDKSAILGDFLDAFRRGDRARAWAILSQSKELVTGSMVAGQAVDAYLDADAAGRAGEAQEMLRALAHVAELEKSNAGDPLFEELSGYYERISPAGRSTLRRARSEMKSGYAVLIKGELGPALERFDEASRIFHEVGNSWERDIAEYQRSYCLSRLDKIRESNDLLAALLSRSERMGYRWLGTLAGFGLANNYYLLGEHSESVKMGERTLRTALETDDTYNARRTMNQLAEQYSLIGDAPNALKYAHMSLAAGIPSYYYPPRQRVRDLYTAAECLQEQNHLDLAASVGEELLRFARDVVRDDWMVFSAHESLGLNYTAARQFGKAEQHIESSMRLADSFGDESLRRNLTAQALTNRAHLLASSGSCDSAIPTFDRALEIYAGMEFSLDSYRAQKGRLVCFIREKNHAAVLTEMNALIDLFEKNRERIEEESHRNVFFNKEQGIYDLATDFAIAELKDPETAFNYAEQSRARSLLKSMHGDSGGRPVSLDEARSTLPPGIQVLHYAVLPDRIAIWHIANGRSSYAEVPITADRLDGKVGEHFSAIVRHSDVGSVRAYATELYRWLVEPVAGLLNAEMPVAIIPDKSLNRVPFASLVSPSTGRYLIEEHSLLYAPSTSALLSATALGRERKGAEIERMLSVGDPAFSREEHPGLRRLDDAKGEARAVAGLYTRSTLLIGEDATRSRVLQHLADADVFHFAGHYVPNNRSPQRSSLLLTADGSARGGDLPVSEIVQRKHDRLRLVVLAACETGMEKIYRGEGAIGAARAFLGSGVPSVVATQWPVESAATADLMARMHRYRVARKGSTFDGLRSAQLDQIRAGDAGRFSHPFYWAGVIHVGGFVSY